MDAQVRQAFAGQRIDQRGHRAHLLAGAEFVAPADEEEEDQLDDAWGVDAQSRLSCCVRVKGTELRGGRDAGLALTLGVALLSLALAVLLGLAGAAAKLSRSPFWRRLATAYTTLIRGVPDLVLMLLIFYGGQTVANALAEQLGCEGCVDIDPFTAGVATLGVIFGG
eukprot:gene19002-biopygen5867